MPVGATYTRQSHCFLLSGCGQLFYFCSDQIAGQCCSAVVPFKELPTDEETASASKNSIFERAFTSGSPRDAHSYFTSISPFESIFLLCLVVSDL